MIGEDQASGYKDDFAEEPAKEKTKEEIEKEAFEKRKKVALLSIGRTDDGTGEPKSLNPDQIQAMANMAMSPDKMQKQKADSMTHDLITLRTQMNEMVNVLNKLQTGFVSKIGELERRIDSKLESQLQQIQGKIDKINR